MTFEEEKLCTGMVLVFIGGCVYNVSIVVLKLKVLNLETFEFEWMNEKEKIILTNGVILVMVILQNYSNDKLISLKCGDIIAICLSSNGENQIIFFAIFISLYVVQPFLFLPVKGYRFKFIHCTLMLLFFTAALVFVVFAEKPYLPALSAPNSSSWFPFGSVPNDYQVDGAWFGAIMCALLFVHFTMTALVQADLTAVDKINEEEINEWMLEELEIISAKPAFEHNKF
ncbi:hypothetical protein PRIPAC_94116 [Pristionchus pacificus]|uniref:Uncharacterized protein n=1 Tax=Pristionchus pacificus TaxID=54126 RepID=A0A2A6BB94_PRIPA|nr:hypothetical protein PRIPAC_94116 [Pristionchus pacificus]|eukprot:PDM63146.1 hypothetical protein PRIPAC_50361 [Pristionchus pacificus]